MHQKDTNPEGLHDRLQAGTLEHRQRWGRKRWNLREEHTESSPVRKQKSSFNALSTLSTVGNSLLIEVSPSTSISSKGGIGGITNRTG